jgi:hypothetical protein
VRVVVEELIEDRDNARRQREDVGSSSITNVDHSHPNNNDNIDNHNSLNSSHRHVRPPQPQSSPLSSISGHTTISTPHDAPISAQFTSPPSTTHRFAPRSSATSFRVMASDATSLSGTRIVTPSSPHGASRQASSSASVVSVSPTRATAAATVAGGSPSSSRQRRSSRRTLLVNPPASPAAVSSPSSAIANNNNYLRPAHYPAMPHGVPHSPA